MKPKALYHLLLDRARHMRVHDIAQITTFIDAVEDSIDIDFAHSTYKIKWDYQGQSHTLDVKHTDFKFYIRSDLGQPPLVRGIRRENWDAAFDVWRKMARQSGYEWPNAVEEHANSLGLKLTDERHPLRQFLNHYAILAAVLLAFGAVLVGTEFAISAMLTGVSLAYLSRGRDGLRRAPWPAWFNDWAIALFALALPYFYDVDQFLFLAVSLSSIAIFNILETYWPFNKPLWLLAFLGLSCLCYFFQNAAISYGFILFAILWLICLVVIPGRYARVAVSAGLILLLVANIVSVFAVHDTASVPAYIWVIVLISAFMAAFGWFIGDMSSLSPWFVHSFIGFIGIGVLLTSDQTAAFAVSAVLCFSGIEFTRLLIAFRGTKAAPIILSDGTKTQ